LSLLAFNKIRSWGSERFWENRAHFISEKAFLKKAKKLRKRILLENNWALLKPSFSLKQSLITNFSELSRNSLFPEILREMIKISHSFFLKDEEKTPNISFFLSAATRILPPSKEYRPDNNDHFKKKNPNFNWEEVDGGLINRWIAEMSWCHLIFNRSKAKIYSSRIRIELFLNHQNFHTNVQ